MNRCVCICLAEHFDFSALERHFSARDRCARYRDVLHLDSGGHAFVFDYGVLVAWGLDAERLDGLLRELAGFAIGAPPARPAREEFTFELDAAANGIHSDHVSILGREPRSMLALSHAMAQSEKLAVFEEYASQTIEETSGIPRSLADTGGIPLSRKEIARMRGRLLLVESDINLHYGLLDTPEFFWEYPELEELYTITARYLDLQPRIEVLNRKLGIIHALFDMLADEQKHKHSSLLEWIIIWLIAVEIVFFVGHELTGWF